MIFVVGTTLTLFCIYEILNPTNRNKGKTIELRQ